MASPLFAGFYFGSARPSAATIKPLTFLMSTVIFLIRATRTQSDILLSFLFKFFLKNLSFFYKLRLFNESKKQPPDYIDGVVRLWALRVSHR